MGVASIPCPKCLNEVLTWLFKQLDTCSEQANIVWGGGGLEAVVASILLFFWNLQDQKVHRYFGSSQLGTVAVVASIINQPYHGLRHLLSHGVHMFFMHLTF